MKGNRIVNLKTATKLAIAGASLSVALGVVNLLGRLVPSLVEIIYVGHGSLISFLYTLVSISYLLFFIAVASKQK
jgi:hypothetical protein